MFNRRGAIKEFAIPPFLLFSFISLALAFSLTFITSEHAVFLFSLITAITIIASIPISIHITPRIEATLESGYVYFLSAYQEGRILLCIYIPILFLSFVFLYFPSLSIFITSYLHLDNDILTQFEFLMKLILWFIIANVYTIMSLELPFLLSKRMWFFVTKAYIMCINDQDQEINKVDNLMNAIDSYNIYLVKRLGIKFDNAIVYYKLLYTDKDRLKDIILQFKDSIKSDNSLDLLKSIIKLVNVDDRVEFIYSDKEFHRLKESLAIIIPIVTIVIAIIGLMMGINT